MKIPVDLEKTIEITDEIYTFSEIIDEIDLYKYYSDKKNIMGRPTGIDRFRFENHKTPRYPPS